MLAPLRLFQEAQLAGVFVFWYLSHRVPLLWALSPVLHPHRLVHWIDCRQEIGEMDLMLILRTIASIALEQTRQQRQGG
jgi:hypothetical protein